MSRFHGQQDFTGPVGMRKNKGVLAALRALRRLETETRNATTLPERRAAYRRGEAPSLTARRHLPDHLRGDGPCMGCGTLDNIGWSTPAPVWNMVIRESSVSPWLTNEPILCINCFVTEADHAGARPHGWMLTPQWPQLWEGWQQARAPDGRPLWAAGLPTDDEDTS